MEFSEHDTAKYVIQRAKEIVETNHKIILSIQELSLSKQMSDEQRECKCLSIYRDMQTVNALLVSIGEVPTYLTLMDALPQHLTAKSS